MKRRIKDPRLHQEKNLKEFKAVVEAFSECPELHLKLPRERISMFQHISIELDIWYEFNIDRIFEIIRLTREAHMGHFFCGVGDYCFWRFYGAQTGGMPPVIFCLWQEQDAPIFAMIQSNATMDFPELVIHRTYAQLLPRFRGRDCRDDEYWTVQEETRKGGMIESSYGQRFRMRWLSQTKEDLAALADTYRKLFKEECDLQKVEDHGDMFLHISDCYQKKYPDRWLKYHEWIKISCCLQVLTVAADLEDKSISLKEGTALSIEEHVYENLYDDSYFNPQGGKKPKMTRSQQALFNALNDLNDSLNNILR